MCLAASEILNSFDLGGPYYHAGSAAIAAFPHWRDVVIGPIPTILGATRNRASAGLAIKVVAIMSEDIAAHALMVTEDEYASIVQDPATKLPGQSVLLTMGSTAQMYLERCLAGWHITLEQMNVVKEDQEAQIRHALIDRKSNVAAVWTSFTYLAENDAAKAKALHCPDLGDLQFPTFIVARADLLNESDTARLAANRKVIAAFVAKYLGAWASAKQKPADAAKRLAKTYLAEGIKVTEAQAAAELEARRPPDLQGQVAAFTAPAGGVAPLAVTLNPIIDFMVRTGELKASERPNAADLLHGSILQLIVGDPRLSSIAGGSP